MSPGNLFDWLEDVATFVWSVSGAVLLALSVVILTVAVVQGWRRSRRTEIVISNLADGTGDATAGAAVIGLTYRLREGFLSALPRLGDYARGTVERGKLDSTSPIRSLVLDDIARDSLLRDIATSQQELTESMESLVPEKALGAYRVVAATLFRPNEVHVSGVLQRRHDRLGGLGISFTVHHLGSESAASRITLWEDEPTPDATTTKSVGQRFHELMPAASSALACELLRQRLLATVHKQTLRQRVAIRRRNRHVRTPDAVVEFLVGSSYESAAHLHAPATKSFYKLAERALVKSVKHLDHYKVSFLLANTLSELARRQGHDADRATSLLWRSSKVFEEARDKLHRADLPAPLRRAEAMKVRAALTMNACLAAELLADDVGPGANDVADVAELIKIDPGDYENADVLYNVACTLAVAARVKTLASQGVDCGACRRQAERWLLHACARNDRWWRRAEADPDLGLLHEWIPAARRRLRESVQSPLDAQSIGALVDGVLEAMAPTSHRGRRRAKTMHTSPPAVLTPEPDGHKTPSPRGSG